MPVPRCSSAPRPVLLAALVLLSSPGPALSQTNPSGSLSGDADVSFTNLEMFFHDYEPSPAAQSGGASMRAEPKPARELVRAGAGEDLHEAREARFLETYEGRVALISVSSTFADASRAGAPRGGARGRPTLADRDLGRKIIQDLIDRSRPNGTTIEWDAARGIGVVKIPPENAASRKRVVPSPLRVPFVR